MYDHVSTRLEKIKPLLKNVSNLDIALWAYGLDEADNNTVTYGEKAKLWNKLHPDKYIKHFEEDNFNQVLGHLSVLECYVDSIKE